MMAAAWLDLLPLADPGDVPEWLTPIGMRVAFDFGVSALEWRGAYRNAGG